MTDGPKLGLVLRVRLDAQTGREDELADRGAEAGEEGVEGLYFCARGKRRGCQRVYSFICSFVHSFIPGLGKNWFSGVGFLFLIFLFFFFAR